MSQSLSNVLIHLVFSTKDRRPFLSDETFQKDVHRQLGATSKTLNCPPIVVGGGVDDHVHLLARQSRTITLAEWVNELKRVTSIWTKDQNPKLNTFQWQAGYGAFSVSQSNCVQVAEYIRDQEKHHQKMDFKSEFRTLLLRHETEFDERYVWD
jgi:putative transposase